MPPSHSELHLELIDLDEVGQETHSNGGSTGNGSGVGSGEAVVIAVRTVGSSIGSVGGGGARRLVSGLGALSRGRSSDGLGGSGRAARVVELRGVEQVVWVAAGIEGVLARGLALEVVGVSVVAPSEDELADVGGDSSLVVLQLRCGAIRALALKLESVSFTVVGLGLAPAKLGAGVALTTAPGPCSKTTVRYGDCAWR